MNTSMPCAVFVQLCDSLPLNPALPPLLGLTKQLQFSPTYMRRHAKYLQRPFLNFIIAVVVWVFLSKNNLSDQSLFLLRCQFWTAHFSCSVLNVWSKQKRVIRRCSSFSPHFVGSKQVHGYTGRSGRRGT